MPDVKKPQDHKPKTEKVAEYFTFTSRGEQFTMPNRTLDVITTKFVRQNRRRDETDYALTAIEALAGDDETILDAFDALTRDELKACMKDLADHTGASLGE